MCTKFENPCPNLKFLHQEPMTATGRATKFKVMSQFIRCDIEFLLGPTYNDLEGEVGRGKENK